VEPVLQFYISIDAFGYIKMIDRANFCSNVSFEQLCETGYDSHLENIVSGGVAVNNYGPENQLKEKTDYGTYTSIVLHTAYDIDGESEKSFTPFYDGRFKVEYTTGYVVLPDDLKQGWLAQILYLYENRGDENKQGLSEIAKDLVAPYRDLSWV
jgi:hypothetical protein